MSKLNIRRKKVNNYEEELNRFKLTNSENCYLYKEKNILNVIIHSLHCTMHFLEILYDRK